MKIFLLVLIALICFAEMANAQESDIKGIWKLSESFQYGDQTKTYTLYITFKDNGVIELAGRDDITWLKNESENTLTINGSLFEGIEGENKIETFNDKELELKNFKGEIISLQRIGRPKGKELTNKFTGEWLLEKVEKDGKTDFMGELIDLNSNGILYFGGHMFGEWNYNNTTKGIFFDTREDGEKLNGEHPILKSNKTAFIINVEDAKLYFLKIDREKIAKENSASGLIGTWEIENKANPEGRNFIIFKTSDELAYVVKTINRRQEGGAMWIFNKKDRMLTMIGFYDVDMPEGESKIIKLDDNNLELENNGKIYSLKREKKQNIKIERLTYTQEDFYDENDEFKYSDDEKKLPWNDPMEMMMTLVNVKQLVYKHSTLIEGVNIFESKTLTANVNSNPQEQELSIDYIFHGYDSYNLPDDSELPPNEYNNTYGYGYNKLYPEEDNSFRVVGEEEITTPAGTFNCTIIEAIEGFDEKLKIWMIVDKPYIFAKIIKENTDEMYGYYHIYELQEIKK